MQEITEYTGCNRATITRCIKEDNLPAVKIDDRWESNTDLIDDFRRL